MQIFVNYPKLIKNLAKVKKHVFKDTKICAVVKANGYGHGIVSVAQTLQNYVDYFAVARVDEGVELRQNSIQKPILVLNPYFDEKQAEICAEKDISLTVDNLCDLTKVAKYGVNIHLKADTGMNRVGTKNIDEFLQIVKKCKQKNLCVQGVFSHFASAVNLNSKLTISQYKKFCDFADVAKKYYPNCLLHICNSANTKKSPAFHFDMVRVGIDLYDGCKTVVGKVVEVKNIFANDGVGYGHDFVAGCDDNIAVIDCGYGDGLPRCFKGEVITKYGKTPVISNVCMDMLTVKNPQNMLKRGEHVPWPQKSR